MRLVCCFAWWQNSEPTSLRSSLTHATSRVGPTSYPTTRYREDSCSQAGYRSGRIPSDRCSGSAPTHFAGLKTRWATDSGRLSPEAGTSRQWSPLARRSPGYFTQWWKKGKNMTQRYTTNTGSKYLTALLNGYRLKSCVYRTKVLHALASDYQCVKI